MTLLEPQREGIPLPVPTVTSQPFWDGCARGELRYQCCVSCARPIFIPAADLSAAGTAPGIAGKVMGLPAGLLVITWRLDGMAVDSGIRADDPQVQASWIDAANELIGGPWSPTQPPVKPDGTAPESNGAPA